MHRLLPGPVSHLLALLLCVPAARAQSFPAASAWQALPCGISPMTDRRRDEPGAIGERDLVGSEAAPAALSAADPSFVYLQLRVDGDPLQAGKLRPVVWGFELSPDRDPTSYDLLLVLNGISGAVEVYRNSAMTQPGDPADPADAPPALSYPLATHARVSPAEGSSFGGDPDFLVTLALPWKDLAPLGLLPRTPALIWAGTSSSGNGLDGDLACHDGGDGAPGLGQIGGVAVVLDPSLDTDGDRYPDSYEVRFGADPTSAASHPAGQPPPAGSGPSSLAIEGGGGCSLGSPRPTAAALLLVLFALLLAARRRG